MDHATDPGLVLEAFDRNAEVNAALLDALTDADLHVPDGRGGWTVGQHLGHLANFRSDWLGFIAPALAAVRELLAAGRSFERVYESHPTAFLLHTVVHDAHHRGQVLAALRAAGKPLAWLDGVDDATWSVWRR